MSEIGVGISTGRHRKLSGGSPTILVSDSFNRANSATTLGSTDSYTGGTAKTWASQDGGVWGVQNNQAYVASSGTGYNLTLVQSNASDVTIDLDTTVNNQSGIVFRNTDNNNFFQATIDTTSGGLILKKLVANSYSTIGSYAFSIVTGTSYHLKVVAIGSSIQVYLNGTLRITATDSFNSTATLHGLRDPASGSYFDNFVISA